jgi:hypothetical protein
MTEEQKQRLRQISQQRIAKTKEIKELVEEWSAAMEPLFAMQVEVINLLENDLQPFDWICEGCWQSRTSK